MQKQDETAENCPTLTIFAVPRAFEGAHALWQDNALGTWTRVEPRPEVILFGDDAGVAEAAARHGCRHVRKVARSKHGVPLISDVFCRAQGTAANRLCCYVNSDIMILGGLVEAARDCDAFFADEPWLAVGRRVDGDVKDPVDFRGDWRERTWRHARKSGRWHSPRGEDWFLFTRGLWPGVPPFAVGRTAWDNWLVLDTTRRGIATVDASAIVRAAHQGKSKRKGYAPEPGSRALNQRIWREAGGVDDGGYTTSTRWVMTDQVLAFRKRADGERSPWK